MKFSDAVKRLQAAGIENARSEARALFSHFGKIPTAVLLSEDANCDLPELDSAISRRESREPLQYIIGEVGFFREYYKVTPDCLIPRADTEALVDFAVKNIPEGEFFLDLCTGSGCVAVSTLKNTKNTRASALDISADALALAKENAELNGVSERLTFTECDLMSDFPKFKTAPYAILSNPPYVADAVYEALAPEISFEPKIAFTAGDDGGDFYRRLVPLCKSIIKPQGFFAFEIGYDQGELSSKLAELNGLSVDIIKDLSGNDRVAVFKIKA